jgi:hypothetical protein
LSQKRERTTTGIRRRAAPPPDLAACVSAESVDDWPKYVRTACDGDCPIESPFLRDRCNEDLALEQDRQALRRTDQRPS